MTPEELSQTLTASLQQVVAEQRVDIPIELIPESIRVERPKSREHGDWATNIALQLSKPAKLPPRQLAEILAPAFASNPGIASVEVAGPGFLNITLDAAAAGELARTVLTEGAAYGTSSALAGEKINLEFVSANPTGPIHLGGTRWAAVGDSLARLFESQGATVGREYYFNDHGAQIDRFARSLVASALGQPAPEDGYGGEYIQEIKDRVLADHPEILDLDGDALQEAFREYGVTLMFEEIKASLHNFRVDFDVYFHEDSLHESGAVHAVLERLKASGNLYHKDGAWWLKSTDFGDDKDRVVIKSDGDAAYIAGDIAYFEDKMNRGFTKALYLLGADHHGYVARLKAAAAALGHSPESAEVLIGQMVNLVKDGKPVRMSKRAGTIVRMEDLVDVIGVDAARYALSRYSADSNIDIDLDLLSKRSNDNPVFYVQYAHARTKAVARNAETLGVKRSADGEDLFDPTLLDHATENALLAALGEYPSVLAQATQFREPHRIARQLETIASAYHKWYDARRVTPLAGEDVTLENHTRLWLNDATSQVLANGLSLLGVSAPERM